MQYMNVTERLLVSFRIFSPPQCSMTIKRTAIDYEEGGCDFTSIATRFETRWQWND